MVDLLDPPRSTEEVNSAEEGAPPHGEEPTETPSSPWWQHRPYPLIGRWLVLVAAVGIAFHQTIVSVAIQTTNGDPLAYLFLLPVWGVVLLFGTQLQRGRDLDIHDRQVDWVIAIGVAGFIMMLDVLLRPRLGATAGLVRIDVLALVLFVMVGCILLFGTRATGQSWAAWAFLLACWPLPYRLIGAALGGTNDTYALLNVMLSAVVVMVAAGRPRRRRLVAGVLTVVVGVLAFGVASIALPPVAVQVAPSVAALAVVVAVDLRRNRGVRRLPVPSAGSGSVVVKPVAAMVALLVFGGAIGIFAQFAPATLDPQTLPITGPGWTTSAVVPSGWTNPGRHRESWADRYFGTGSSWYRYQFVSTPKTSHQRVVVDALTVPDVGPLSVYPAIACYKLSVPYLESPTPVPLGHGVEATLFYANSYEAASPVLARWAMLTWTWKMVGHGTTTFQRITVLALDGATGIAGFPVASAPGSNNSVRNTFTDILRGVSTSASPAPSQMAMNRLKSFSSDIVARQSAARPL
jgi:hypothetical protein